MSEANSLTGNIGASYKQAMAAVKKHETKLAALLPNPVPPLAAPGTPDRKNQQNINELYSGLNEVKEFVQMLGEVVAMECPSALRGGRRTRRTRRHR